MRKVRAISDVKGACGQRCERPSRTTMRKICANKRRSPAGLLLYSRRHMQSHALVERLLGCALECVPFVRPAYAKQWARSMSARISKP